MVTHTLRADCRAIVRKAQDAGLAIHDGNIVDLCADNLGATLSEIREALRLEGLFPASRFNDARMSLDVDAPDKVAAVLRYVADKYNESESELASAWQDPNAGKDWGYIARELAKLADKLVKRIP